MIIPASTNVYKEEYIAISYQLEKYDEKSYRVLGIDTTPWIIVAVKGKRVILRERGHTSFYGRGVQKVYNPILHIGRIEKTQEKIIFHCEASINNIFKSSTSLKQGDSG